MTQRSGTARKFKKKNLIPWPHHWGHGVRKDGLHYRGVDVAGQAHHAREGGALMNKTAQKTQKEVEPRWCHDIGFHKPHRWSESGRKFKCPGVKP